MAVKSESKFERLCHFLDESNYFLFELSVFFRQLAFSLTYTIYQVLIQDKTCRVMMGKSYDFCINLETQGDDNAANDVYDKSSGYTSWMGVVFAVPSFVWFPFLGSFLDNFPKKTLWMLGYYIVIDLIRIGVQWSNVFAFSLSVYYILLSSIPYWLNGGWVVWNACSYKFISETSTEDTRSIRFVALQVAIVLGRSIASFVNAAILQPDKAADSSHLKPLRTYNNSFYGNIACNVLALTLLFIVYKLEQRRAKRLEPTVDPNPKLKTTKHDKRKSEEEVRSECSEIQVESGESKATDPKTKSSDGFIAFLRKVFSCKSMKQTWHCITKPREGGLRCQIFTIYGMIFLLQLVENGTDSTFLQFTEKAYCWTANEFQNYSGIQYLVAPVMVAIVAWVLFQKLKISDGCVMVYGHFLPCLGNVLRGIILSNVAFFVTIPLLGLYDLIGISVRAKMSKIVPPDEVGTILSINAIIDMAMWMMSTLVFTAIFQAVFKSYVGIVWHLCAGCILISLGIAVFEELFFKDRKQD